MNAADFELPPWLRDAPGDAYVRFARALAAACAPGGPSVEAFRRFGSAEFAAPEAPFGGDAAAVRAAAPFARDVPPLGPTREQQLRWQAWSHAAREFAAAAQAHATVLAETGALAGERYAARLAAPGALQASLRALFDEWIECAERAWQEAAHGERFCSAQARLLNAFVAWRAAAQAIAAECARAVDVPTRSEVDELQRTVCELQRTLAELRSAEVHSERAAVRERVDATADSAAPTKRPGARRSANAAAAAGPVERAVPRPAQRKAVRGATARRRPSTR